MTIDLKILSPGMKLNANTEQIEGELYFDIRGNFSLKFG